MLQINWPRSYCAINILFVKSMEDSHLHCHVWNFTGSSFHARRGQKATSTPGRDLPCFSDLQDVMLTHVNHPYASVLPIREGFYTHLYVQAHLGTSAQITTDSLCWKQHLRHVVVFVTRRRLQNIRKAACMKQNISLRMDLIKLVFPGDFCWCPPTFQHPNSIPMWLLSAHQEETPFARRTHLPHTHMLSVLLPGADWHSDNLCLSVP